MSREVGDAILSPRAECVCDEAAGGFLPSLADFAHRSDARRAPGLAFAGGQQVRGQLQQATGHAVERRALAHSAGIAIVEI